MKLVTILAVLLVLPAIGFAQTTWYVPDDFPGGIQSAISDPSVINGDTIIVRPGTYLENIDFIGKAITVKSEQGAAVTTIDGNQAGSVVTFKSGEGADSVLEGFTVTNGNFLWGGGIYCDSSSPTIINNIITDNSASDFGGGIWCSNNSSPVLTNNTVTGNSAGLGGGIWCSNNSSPILTNNTVTGNSADLGGGIYCNSSSPTITNTIIWNNHGWPNGREIYLHSGSPIVTYCNVRDGWPGPGNIDANPLFLGATDFHIVSFSPCKDAGDNGAPALPVEDFEGDPRVIDGVVDIGADEWSTHHGSPGIYYVPGDYSTIQEAIDSSFPMDEIIVSPGTYNENIDFDKRVINVHSSHGPDETYIDGGQTGSGVTFKGGEDAESILEGFAITNGYAKYGGGICCENNSSPTLINNTITNNTVSHDGGGIYFMNSSPTLTNNTITWNSTEGVGGGIYCAGSGNQVITNNLISKNSAYNGAGIFCEGNQTIAKNIIVENTASCSGGGIGCFSAQNITNNIISKNTAGDDGGGIYCGSGISNITNNTITGNAAFDCGGGIYIEGYYFGPTSLTANNTILWDNAASNGQEIGLGFQYYYASTLNISYSDVKGGQSSVFVKSGCTLNWGPGMIDSEPLFVDETNNDYHLTFNSPCRGSGDNATPGLPDHDFEDDPRICGSTVDMGADEYWHHLYFSGDPVPGGSVTLKVVGIPGKDPVIIYRGSLWTVPLSTQFGMLYIKPPWKHILHIGPVPANGIATTTKTIPSGVSPGSEFYFQALHGPANSPNTILTNLMTLTVE